MLSSARYRPSEVGRFAEATSPATTGCRQPLKLAGSADNRPASTRLLHEQRLAALRETLDAESLQAALAEGADAPADQLIAALHNNLP
jgi:hypothetical protein